MTCRPSWMHVSKHVQLFWFIIYESILKKKPLLSSLIILSTLRCDMTNTQLISIEKSPSMIILIKICIQVNFFFFVCEFELIVFSYKLFGKMFKNMEISLEIKPIIGLLYGGFCMYCAYK